MPLSPGTRVGPYEVIGVIGVGGMGEVYRAHDSRLRRDVAIKTLPAQLSRDAERLRRFEREALATAALNHPNVLAVYDTGSHRGVPYVVTELLAGETLRDLLSRETPAPARAVQLATQLAEGLGAAHGRGIIHRDLKPENVFLTSGGVIKILDLGIAKLTEAFAGPAADTPTATGTALGTTLGTPGYMSPEQVRGLAVDHRSDLFSFGAILYELLSGKRAFAAQTAVETLHGILHEDPLAVAHGIPPPLVDVVRRCLAKEPGERFQSASELKLALVQIEPGADARPGNRSGSRVAARRTASLAAAGLLAALIGYTAFHFLIARPVTLTAIRIASAQPGTVSMTVAQGIVDAVNRSGAGLEASLVVTEGAVAAVRRLDSGDVEFALANSQLAFDAVKTDRLLGHPSPQIAGAAVLFGVPVHVILPRRAQIAALEELRGHRICLGAEGTGERFMASRLLEYFQLSPGDYTEVSLDIDAALSALRGGTIDAYVAARGVPHLSIATAMAAGGIRLFSFDTDRMEGLRINQPFMLPFTIPKGTYPRQEASVTTVSTKILLLASTRVHQEVIERLLDAIANRLPDVIARHPSAAEINLARKPTVGSGMSIELHPGAAKYYRAAAKE